LYLCSSGALSTQIEGDDGEELIASDVVKQAGGISGGAYGSGAVFSAGVQFTITDPVAQVWGAAHRGSRPAGGHTAWQCLPLACSVCTQAC
jgi:hypothetical protein